MALVESPGRGSYLPATYREVRASPSLFTWIVFLGTFAILVPREAAGIDSPSPGILYELAFGDFRWVDLALLAILGLVVAFRGGTGRLFRLHVPPEVGRWSLVFGLAIVISMIHGSIAGGTELFFDWRGLAVGGSFMFLLYQLVRTNPQALKVAAFSLITILVGRASYHLVTFFAGTADVTLQGVRIPVFDGPTLSATVFAVITAGCLAVGWKEGSLNARLFFGCLASVALLLVVLAFRRTYWGEAFVGLVAILLIFNRKRLSALLTIVALSLAFLPFLPAEYQLRAASVNPFSQTENRYTVTNEDHLNDLRDAWDVIKKDPVLGYGLGRPYSTHRIENWKFISWGVHNAILHVWLRYGALGLISYVALHIVTLRWLLALSRRFRPQSFERWWVIAAFSYLAATFAVSLFASPWPYGATQNSILIFGVIGTTFAMQAQARHDADEEESSDASDISERRTPRLA